MGKAFWQWLPFLLIGILVGFLLCTGGGAPQPDTMPLTQAVEVAMQSSVKLTIDPGHSLGSGVVVSTDGLVVTNAHLLEKGTWITVTLPDGSEHMAKLLAQDDQLDLALLRLDMDTTPALPAEGTPMAAGEAIFAIGNPGDDIPFTVTEGIISGPWRQIETKGRSMQLLQHTAAINPGNSGGGLFDAQGRLVGIVNMRAVAGNQQGIGFAIPVSIVTEFVAKHQP